MQKHVESLGEHHIWENESFIVLFEALGELFAQMFFYNGTGSRSLPTNAMHFRCHIYSACLEGSNNLNKNKNRVAWSKL